MKKYYKGRRLEYKFKKILESEGYIVFRCAGSKPIDLIAIYPGTITTHLIEVKAGKASKESTEKLKFFAERLKHVNVWLIEFKNGGFEQTLIRP